MILFQSKHSSEFLSSHAHASCSTITLSKRDNIIFSATTIWAIQWRNVPVVSFSCQQQQKIGTIVAVYSNIIATIYSEIILAHIPSTWYMVIRMAFSGHHNWISSLNFFYTMIVIGVIIKTIILIITIRNCVAVLGICVEAVLTTRRHSFSSCSRRGCRSGCTSSGRCGSCSIETSRFTHRVFSISMADFNMAFKQLLGNSPIDRVKSESWKKKLIQRKIRVVRANRKSVPVLIGTDWHWLGIIPWYVSP